MTNYLTSIKIFAKAPVDPTLTDICMLPSRGAWETALAGYQINAADQCSYQRDRGVIRYPGAYPALSHANYCSFYNNAHQGLLGQVYRWYAFITKVTYINDNMTELEIKVDPFHTYQTEISAGLGTAYVERMHTNTDEPGDNTLDDGIACGDYVSPYYDFLDLSDMWVIIASTKTLPDADENAPGSSLNGVLSGFQLYGYSTTAAAALIKTLADAGKSSCIQFMYMCPKAIAGLLGNLVVPVPGFTLYTPSGIPLDTVDGYTPRNKKLLTYPYVGYTLSTPTASQTYRKEFFSGNITFRGMSTSAPGGGICLYPQNYGGNMGKQMGVKFTDFPICSWQSENFNTWLATQGLRQEAASDARAVSTILNAGLSLVGGNPVGAVGSFVNFALAERNMGIERQIASLQAPRLSGGNTSLMTDIVNQKVGYEFVQRTIRAEVAETIDSYYDLYGYPIRKMQLLTMQAAPRKWRYVRTIGYRLRSNVPQPYCLEVENAFNNGVRFWASADEFLNYTLDNSPA